MSWQAKYNEEKLMSQKRVPLKLIIFSLLAILAAGIVAAGKAGVFDAQSIINKTLGNLPLIGENINVPEETQENQKKIPAVSPLEEENKILNLKIKELEIIIAGLENEKADFAQKMTDLQQEVLELRKYQEENEKKILNAEELAAYYQEMKPEAVVGIFDRLDDETVMLILPLLERDQVGKIFSLMEPQRAAFLSQVMLGKKSAEE